MAIVGSIFGWPTAAARRLCRDWRVDAGSGADVLLPKKPAASQARIRCRPFAQIWDEWIDQPLTRLARAINRSVKATLDAFANGLAIETELAGDR